MTVDRERRFDVTSEALERSAHAPLQEQTEVMPESGPDSAAWAWDEERRQSRQAAGA